MVRLTLSVPRPVLLLALAAVAAVIAGPTFAQDLSAGPAPGRQKDAP